MAVAEKRSLCISLNEFYKCPFYWGKIDRKEAEAILKDQPDGSYLWKDPDEINKNETSVEFVLKKNSKCIYGKILICQRSQERNGGIYIRRVGGSKFFMGHSDHQKIFFDLKLLDGLNITFCRQSVLTENFNLLEETMELFKDACKMGSFFSAMAFLNNPVHRNRPFSLKELVGKKICNSGITNEGISKLEIPKVLQIYLQEHWVEKEN